MMTVFYLVGGGVIGVILLVLVGTWVHQAPADVPGRNAFLTEVAGDWERLEFYCRDPDLRRALRKMGARRWGRQLWLNLPKHDEARLAEVMRRLQGLGVVFLDCNRDYPPAAVFEVLRDRGLVTGRIRRVNWHGTKIWQA